MQRNLIKTLVSKLAEDNEYCLPDTDKEVNLGQMWEMIFNGDWPVKIVPEEDEPLAGPKPPPAKPPRGPGPAPKETFDGRPSEPAPLSTSPPAPLGGGMDKVTEILGNLVGQMQALSTQVAAQGSKLEAVENQVKEQPKAPKTTRRAAGQMDLLEGLRARSGAKGGHNEVYEISDEELVGEPFTNATQNTLIKTLKSIVRGSSAGAGRLDDVEDKDDDEEIEYTANLKEGGLREIRRAREATIVVPPHGGKIHLNIPEEERLAPAYLHRILTLHGTMSDYVNQEEVFERKGQARNKYEAISLARSIDLLLNEFGWNRMHKSRAMEVMCRRLFALEVASQEGGWKVAEALEEVAGSRSLREQVVLKRTMGQIKLANSVTALQASSNKSAKAEKSARAPGAEDK